MKKARRSFGEDYICQQDWEENIFVQCGDDGIVLVQDGDNYRTAFFEAFPKQPSCFIRGEGKNVEEAELEAWNKYQKILTCNHEMERRNRKDGYGYCKHCSYSSMVFEPLTKCCKCKKPCNYSTDEKGNNYCKEHHRLTPIKYRGRGLFTLESDKLPRKSKKQLTKAVTKKFRLDNIKGTITRSKYGTYQCGEWRLPVHFKQQRINLIKKFK